MIQWDVEERGVDATKVFVASLQMAAFLKIFKHPSLWTAFIIGVRL